MELEAIKKIAAELHPKLKALEREWYLDSIVLCLRHKGKCEYCGIDLLSSQGICYHFWCVDHLLPQSKYRELKDCLENKVLACRACNSAKGDFDPNDKERIYSGNDQFSAGQRDELLKHAREHVRKKRECLDRDFQKELALLKPFI